MFIYIPWKQILTFHTNCLQMIWQYQNAITKKILFILFILLLYFIFIFIIIIIIIIINIIINIA